MDGRSEELTEPEQDACQCLLKTEWPLLYSDADDMVLDNNEYNSPSKFQKLITAQKQRPHRESSFQSSYLACEWISPTTVVVESLFSKCSRVMTADRRHMHPRLFEAIVCLRENTEWWDLELVQDMVAGLWDDRLKEVYNYDGIDDEMEMYDEEGEDW